MSDKIYPVSAEWAQRAFINEAKYKDMYARSVSDPDAFWGEQGKRIDWILARGAMDVRATEAVTFQQGERWPSDHLPIMVWLTLRDPSFR